MSRRSPRPPFIELNAAGWVAARRHGVPAGMLAEATYRREIGDWRGACVAARFDVRLDLTAIGAQFGADVAVRLEDDLRHLVPDLIRWHLPRWWRGGSGPLVPATRVPLARYGPGPGPVAPTLWVATPAHQDRPQRVELRFGALDHTGLSANSWEQARYLWDARATDGLRRRLGGGDRIPFFHRDGRRVAYTGPATAPDDPVALTEWVMTQQDAGRYEQAWTAAGITASFAPPESGYRRRQVPHDELVAMVPALGPALRAWPDHAVDGARYVLRSATTGWRTSWVTVWRDGDALSARLIERSDAHALPAVPSPWWQRFPDLELLRYGLIEPAGLHPLVRSAFFPDEPSPGRYAPGGPAFVPQPVPVRCRGVWHRVGWSGGRIEPRDHPPEEAQRERVMRSLGGGVPGCFTVTESWRGAADGRLPRALRELRHHALSAITHGDTDEFVRLLELGIDPAGVRDRWGRGPLHYLAKIDGERVLAPLLAAGLDINGRDVNGRTPLGCVLFDGGSASLVRAMMGAGADPTIADGSGETVLHLLRSPEAGDILPALLAAGVDLDGRDEYGRTPLMTQVLTAAPVEAIRAVLTAGADPTATDEYTEQSIVELAGEWGRDDLGFLAAAAEEPADG